MTGREETQITQSWIWEDTIFLRPVTKWIFRYNFRVDSDNVLQTSSTTSVQPHFLPMALNVAMFKQQIKSSSGPQEKPRRRSGERTSADIPGHAISKTMTLFKLWHIPKALYQWPVYTVYYYNGSSSTKAKLYDILRDVLRHWPGYGFVWRHAWLSWRWENTFQSITIVFTTKSKIFRVPTII